MSKHKRNFYVPLYKLVICDLLLLTKYTICRVNYLIYVYLRRIGSLIYWANKIPPRKEFVKKIREESFREWMSECRETKMSRSDPVTPTTGDSAIPRYISRSASRRAVRCRFFRNGDKFFPGHVLPVSSKFSKEKCSNLLNKISRCWTNFVRII